MGLKLLLCMQFRVDADILIIKIAMKMNVFLIYNIEKLWKNNEPTYETNK